MPSERRERGCETTKEGLTPEHGPAQAGFLYMAEQILSEIAPFLDVAPSHRVVLTGHSIGGALATLLSVLLLKRADDRVSFNATSLATYTFAALPCLRVLENASYPVKLLRTVSTPAASASASAARRGARRSLSVLGALELDESRVAAFVQPWDPLVRWYTPYDPCYPLVADIGDDGVTLFASGPARVLRPLARAIFASAKDWPDLRDLYVAEANQTYAHTGDAYLFIPDEARYLADRILNLIVDVPEPAELVKCAPNDLPTCLNAAFPLEEFSISLVPAALRSFVHHFHPAYSAPLVALSNKGTPKPAADMRPWPESLDPLRPQAPP